MKKPSMTLKKILTAGLILVLTLCTLTACGGQSGDGESAEGTEELTTLVLGTSADYAPFEFMYPDDNGDMQYGGIDIYTAQYIADYMDVDLQIENMSFNNLLTSLNKGQFDIVLADIEATEERKNAADFSDPYLTELAPQFLVKKENAEQFKSYSDFEGKTIGAQTATTKLDIISEIPDVNPVALQSVLDLIKEVNYGKVDAILVDGSVAQQYQATNDDLVALSFDELGQSADVCVAVAKGDPKGLLPKINEAIAKLNEENKIEEFKQQANDLADVWQEVSAPEDGEEGSEEDAE
ncbi:MAG: transporter substrate-binding domain-containing protein [Firmicutes bacterium]|nr:transporter substrate-binding domain-containing protein [Bacillota bacterium]MDD7601647.1 transporter substrate-binding domain-containing protein [Bacillota bacterium]MDY5856237.1 transporter substrate-binding domain-containing protein [Anaerovoracaceae bacterium]